MFCAPFFIVLSSLAYDIIVTEINNSFLSQLNVNLKLPSVFVMP